VTESASLHLALSHSRQRHRMLSTSILRHASRPTVSGRTANHHMYCLWSSHIWSTNKGLLSVCQVNLLVRVFPHLPLRASEGIILPFGGSMSLSKGKKDVISTAQSSCMHTFTPSNPLQLMRTFPLIDPGCQSTCNLSPSLAAPSFLCLTTPLHQ
jgi:hypothetical protein